MISIVFQVDFSEKKVNKRDAQQIKRKSFFFVYYGIKMAK